MTRLDLQCALDRFAKECLRAMAPASMKLASTSVTINDSGRALYLHMSTPMLERTALISFKDDLEAAFGIRDELRSFTGLGGPHVPMRNICALWREIAEAEADASLSTQRSLHDFAAACASSPDEKKGHGDEAQH